MTENAQRWPQALRWFKKSDSGGGGCVVQGLAHFRSVQLLLVNLVWRSYVVYKKNVVATQRDFNGCLEASPWPPPPSSFHHDPGHPLPASFQIKWVCAGSNSEAQQNREKSGAADAAHWSFLLRFLFSPLALSSCGLGHSSCDCLHVSGPRTLFLLLLHSKKTLVQSKLYQNCNANKTMLLIYDTFRWFFNG